MSEPRSEHPAPDGALDELLDSFAAPRAGDALQRRLLDDYDRGSGSQRSFSGVRRWTAGGALAASLALGFMIGAATAEDGDLYDAEISPLYTAEGDAFLGGQG